MSEAEGLPQIDIALATDVGFLNSLCLSLRLLAIKMTLYVLPKLYPLLIHLPGPYDQRRNRAQKDMAGTVVQNRFHPASLRPSQTLHPVKTHLLASDIGCTKAGLLPNTLDVRAGNTFLCATSSRNWPEPRRGHCQTRTQASPHGCQRHELAVAGTPSPERPRLRSR